MRRAAAGLAVGLVLGFVSASLVDSTEVEAAEEPAAALPSVTVVDVDPSDVDDGPDWWEWDVERRDRDPDDDEAFYEEAECGIEVMNALGIEITVYAVLLVNDWSDYAYGGPCEHRDAILGGTDDD